MRTFRHPSHACEFIISNEVNNIKYLVVVSTACHVLERPRESGEFDRNRNKTKTIELLAAAVVHTVIVHTVIDCLGASSGIIIIV